MTDLKAQLAQQLNEAQAKYTYFLLAAAASCMALAVQRTSGTALTSHHFPLGLAMLSWGVSFGAGCYNRAYFSSTLYANIAFLQLEDGSHPERPSHPALVSAAMEGVMKAAKENSSAANRWGKWQFRLLIVGAVLFLAWHVLEMVHTGAAAK